ncbi:MAG: ROK family protein, partial [Desulfurococcales archaeon]|nr:ROK family protein [Desulfurococcales archaeon]
LWGRFEGVSDLIYVTLSTGIGGGMIVEGHLLLGREGNAHEVGHIVLNYRSRARCGCGGVGHWEGLASGKNFINLARELGVRINVSSLPQLIEAWRSGDGEAGRVVEELIEVDAAGLASLINVFDPHAVVVGGAIPIKNPDILEAIVKEMSKYLMREPPQLALPTFGEDAVLVGAAAIASSPPPNLLKLQVSSG